MEEGRLTKLVTPWFFTGLELRQLIESAAMSELP